MAATGQSPVSANNPPEHTRVRRLMAEVFTPRAVEALRPRVQRLVDDLFDRAVDRGEMT
jgi:cytochrome P450